MKKHIQKNSSGRWLVSDALETWGISLGGNDHRQNLMARSAEPTRNPAARRWITINRLSEYWWLCRQNRQSDEVW
jgi:hypothetical protein